MKQQTVKFSFRGEAAQVEGIDRAADKYGFKTRTKFLLHAGLNFEDHNGNDDIMSELARMVYLMRQSFEEVNRKLDFLLVIDEEDEGTG